MPPKYTDVFPREYREAFSIGYLDAIFGSPVRDMTSMSMGQRNFYRQGQLAGIDEKIISTGREPFVPDWCFVEPIPQDSVLQ